MLQKYCLRNSYSILRQALHSSCAQINALKAFAVCTVEKYLKYQVSCVFFFPGGSYVPIIVLAFVRNKAI